MDTKATGVQGMHDLALENGVLTSKGKNVKLTGGVRMILNVEVLGYNRAELKTLRPAGSSPLKKLVHLTLR